MFAKDRDLLLYEPRVFTLCGFASQKIFTGTGSVGEFTLAISDTDVLLDSGYDWVGSVVLLSTDRIPYEITFVNTALEANICRIQAFSTDEAIIPPQYSDVPAIVYTFAHQLNVAYDRILRDAGVERVTLNALNQKTAAMIINTDQLKHLQCLIALGLIWRAAGAGRAGDDAANERAQYYEQAAQKERDRTIIAFATAAATAPTYFQKLGSVAPQR